MPHPFIIITLEGAPTNLCLQQLLFLMSRSTWNFGYACVSNHYGGGFSYHFSSVMGSGATLVFILSRFSSENGNDDFQGLYTLAQKPEVFSQMIFDLLLDVGI